MDKPGYNFVDATFAFFQAIGRRPGAVLWIALWHLVLYAALTAAILALAIPFVTVVASEAAQGGEPDVAELLRALSGFIGAYLLAMLGFLLTALMVQGAWLRLLARDEVAKVIPVRFGADELRLLVVNAAFIAFNLLGWGAVFLVFALVNAGLIAAVSSGGEPGAGAVIGAGLINVLLGLAVGVAALILMLRFAAAPALSIRLKALKLFDSFAATKGVAAWMFLSYVVLVGVYLIGATVMAVIQQIIVLIAAADLVPTLAALENTEDPEVVLQVLGQALLQPGVLIAFGLVIVLQMVLQIVFEGSWHGVGAYVARREAGDYPGDAVETPSASVGERPGEG